MFHHSWWSYISYDQSKGRPQISRQLLRRIFGYARPYTLSVAIVLVTIVATSLLNSSRRCSTAT